MRYFYLLAGLLCSLNLMGCASYFTRKSCEQTNWFQHGFNVAMTGKRLDSDDFIRQCQKVDAKISLSEADAGFKAGMNKYCTGDNIYAMGKAGKKFSFEMCDGENEKKMRGRYEEGLRAFCTPSSAYRFGSTGGVYEDVCPHSVEDDWLREYRKGRKIYLTAAVAEKEKEAARLDDEIRRLEREKSSLRFQQSQLANAPVVHRERIYDPATGTYRESVTTEKDPQVDVRSQQLSNDLFHLENKLRSARDQQEKLNSELSKMRTEAAAL